MMINIFAPHFKPLGKLLMDMFNKRVMIKNVKTQDQLNEMFEVCFFNSRQCQMLSRSYLPLTMR